MEHMLRHVIFLALCSLSCFAACPKECESCPDGKQHYRASIRHIESGGIGYDDGYTTFAAFLASDPSWWKVTPFCDIRGHVFDNGKWAANAGIGLRTLWDNRVYGINAYYDYRNAGHLHSNQIGIGFETLGQLLDFRINGYLPVGAKISSPYDPLFKSFTGNYMLVSQKFQSAMKGADAECGFHFGKSAWLDFYAAAGPYYFVGEKAPATWGGKARLAGTFKDILTIEISDSYDRTFHNKFQGQVALSFSFGPKSKVKEPGHSCKVANMLNCRSLQPVDRQEIIVIDHIRKNTLATDPATGLPYFFVFVNNTSNSNGTYESPYHSLTQVQSNSSPNDIIYVFPGNGTTTGMDAGISLQANQKFWGSGVSHSIQTTQGTISIPAQSTTSPIITNTDLSTAGNVITLATNNAISGFTITSALNDAIYGTNPQNLEVSLCTIEAAATFAIETTFTDNASITLTNNQFVNNVNGVSFTLNGTSTIICANNTFENQTSVSNMPVIITANNNDISTYISNNIFNNNTTGSVRWNLNSVVSANINALNNTITNNGTGSLGVLGSSFVIIPSGTCGNSSVALTNNTFSNNTSNSFYVHTSGAFTTFEITASQNKISNNGGSALVFASTSSNFTLNATKNTLTGLSDNGIATVGSTSFQNANITANNNTITNISNGQSAIAISQGSASLNFTAENNVISGCQGSGILCYSNEFTNMTASIVGNKISNCQNSQSNAASGISIDTYVNCTATIADNILSNNVSPGISVGVFTSANPSICLDFTGNQSDTDPSYSFTNPGSGAFNLSPCNVSAVNVGMINTSGSITSVQSCPESAACP